MHFNKNDLPDELWSTRSGYKSWTIKKAEHRRIDAFELWCWRRLLRVPWTAGRSNQSILKEISPGCSLEGLMLKLKLQYFGHLMWRVDSLEKTDAGRDWEQEEKGTTEDEMAWRHHRFDGHESERSWWWTGRPGMLQFMGSQRVGHYWATELNWTVNKVVFGGWKAFWTEYSKLINSIPYISYSSAYHRILNAYCLGIWDSNERFGPQCSLSASSKYSSRSSAGGYVEEVHTVGKEQPSSYRRSDPDN